MFVSAHTLLSELETQGTVHCGIFVSFEITSGSAELALHEGDDVICSEFFFRSLNKNGAEPVPMASLSRDMISDKIQFPSSSSFLWQASWARAATVNAGPNDLTNTKWTRAQSKTAGVSAGVGLSRSASGIGTPHAPIGRYTRYPPRPPRCPTTHWHTSRARGVRATQYTCRQVAGTGRALPSRKGSECRFIPPSSITRPQMSGSTATVRRELGACHSRHGDNPSSRLPRPLTRG